MRVWYPSSSVGICFLPVRFWRLLPYYFKGLSYDVYVYIARGYMHMHIVAFIKNVINTFFMKATICISLRLNSCSPSPNMSPKSWCNVTQDCQFLGHHAVQCSALLHEYWNFETGRFQQAVSSFESVKGGALAWSKPNKVIDNAALQPLAIHRTCLWQHGTKIIADYRHKMAEDDEKRVYKISLRSGGTRTRECASIFRWAELAFRISFPCIAI